MYNEGNLAFDSTMYVLGNTTLTMLQLTESMMQELILMTQGALELARFNKFNDPGSNSIKAYSIHLQMQKCMQ